MQTLNIDASTLALQAGQVIAYPTEGVWGLGCDPHDEAAVQTLLQIKQRPPEKGFILLAANIEQLKPYLTLTDHQYQQLDVAITTTFLVPFHRDTTPPWVVGKHSLLAVRVSKHPIVQALCQQVGYPIISTSANPSGADAAKTAAEVANYFPDIAICQGETGGENKPSRIINFNTGQIIRD